MRDAVREGDTDAALQAALALEAVCAVPYPLLGLMARALGGRGERELDLLCAAGLPLWPRGDGAGRGLDTLPVRAATARLHALAGVLCSRPPAGLVDLEAESGAAISRLLSRGEREEVASWWSRLLPATAAALAYGLAVGGLPVSGVLFRPADRAGGRTMSERWAAYVPAPRVLAELAREECLRCPAWPSDRPELEFLRLAMAGWRVRFGAEEGAILLPLTPGVITAAEELAREEHLPGHERLRAAAIREATRALAASILADYPGGAGF